MTPTLPHGPAAVWRRAVWDRLTGRRRPAPPEVDGVLVSHSHYDHLDRATLAVRSPRDVAAHIDRETMARVPRLTEAVVVEAAGTIAGSSRESSA